MKVVVNISLKFGVLDPQGKAVNHALHTMGFDSIKSVRVGKQIVLDMQDDTDENILKNVTLMCESLLANTVIEDYTIEIVR
ncbi:MAG: phosphoribosylformylglycinamidine synthase subunit PurS [Campylobacterales bacterium]|nr:phosphoribosylformylglycinamidine synthase subunit PurS [Campylobacterales bacterium]